MKNPITQLLSNVWWLLLIRGVAAILLGAFALLGPGITLRFLIIFWAIYVLFDGIVSLFSFFKSGASSPQWWIILSAAFSIIGGCFCIINPDIAVSTFIMVLGWVCILKGIFELIGGLAAKSVWFIIAGLLSLVFGGWCINDPISVAKLITQLVATFALIVGIFFTILSLRLRNMSKSIPRTIDI